MVGDCGKKWGKIVGKSILGGKGFSKGLEIR